MVEKPNTAAIPMIWLLALVACLPKPLSAQQTTPANPGGTTLPSPTMTHPPELPGNFFPTSPPAATFASRLFAPRSTTTTANQPTYRRLTYLPMFGDGGQGGCGTFGTANGNFLVDHPTFACNRLNIAENNSPIPLDRVYVRYGRFDAASHIELDLRNQTVSGSQNIDRFTLGLEQTFLDGQASIEYRVPITTQLTSNLLFDASPSQQQFPINDLGTSLDNVGMIAKFVLWETETWMLSCGLGASFPTAPNVTIDVRVAGNTPGMQPFTANFQGEIENSVFRLTPFVSAAWQPQPRWMVLSFVQLDVPLNDVRLSGRADGELPGATVMTLPLNGDINPQTLLRTNLGLWRRLITEPTDFGITSLSIATELNYTTTIEDAEIVQRTGNLIVNGNPGVDLPQQFAFTVGNLANRIDVLNLSLGLHTEWKHQTGISAGVVTPLRDGQDQPFNLEWILQVNQRF